MREETAYLGNYGTTGSAVELEEIGELSLSSKLKEVDLDVRI
jgi:hypothetical protein